MRICNCLDLDGTTEIRTQDKFHASFVGITLLVVGILSVFLSNCSLMGAGISTIVLGCGTLLYYVVRQKPSNEFESWKFHVLTSLANVILGSLVMTGHIPLTTLGWTNIAIGISRIICCDHHDIVSGGQRYKTGEFVDLSRRSRSKVRPNLENS